MNEYHVFIDESYDMRFSY